MTRIFILCVQDSDSEEDRKKKKKKKKKVMFQMSVLRRVFIKMFYFERAVHLRYLMTSG